MSVHKKRKQEKDRNVTIHIFSKMSTGIGGREGRGKRGQNYITIEFKLHF